MKIRSMTAFAASAQNYDKIKNLLVISKYEEAKTELEKNWTNAKFKTFFRFLRHTRRK